MVRKSIELETADGVEVIFLALDDSGFSLSLQNCIELEMPCGCCQELCDRLTEAAAEIERGLPTSFSDEVRGRRWCWLVGGAAGGAIFLNLGTRYLRMQLGEWLGFGGCSDIHILPSSVQPFRDVVCDLLLEFGASTRRSP